MSTWLLKTEPGAFSFSDLVRAKKSVWDGVTNSLALIHLRKMRNGDRLFIYHTGGEKKIVGLAQAVSDAYPDPKARNPKLVVFDLAPLRALKKPVPLAALKGDARFKDFALVKISRLSVMPVPPAIEKALLALAEE